MRTHTALIAALVAILMASSLTAQEASRVPPALIARAKALELKTPYVPPPGDPLEHNSAGFAKIMCSAVFITGLDPDFAAEHVGYFTSPYAERAKVGKPVIDRVNKAVHVTLPNGVKRTAKYLGDQGCVTLPTGKQTLNFTPIRIPRKLPDPAGQPWPMGDAISKDQPSGIQMEKLQQAVAAAFEPAASHTAAFVVTWKGRIIAERYGVGITPQTPLESWSMGKSLTATLMGILIKQGAYNLSQPAPVPEWQNPGDPRAKIRIADILNMSSGLRIRAPSDPDFDPMGTYPDHLYLYTSGVNSFHYAATRPQQWPPATVGRYRNTDPVLTNYLIRLAVEKRGEEYLSFPWRALFDKIGIRTMVMETDPFGNFLTQGYEFASARDWARLGNLYLQDGVWNSERILPEGFVKFVSTLAPAWKADGRPIYGGFFWINGEGTFPVPKEAYYMAGAGGQTTLIIPSHDLVVVRMGHFKGSSVGAASFRKALALLMEAVPQTHPPNIEREATKLLDEYMATWNSKDTARWESTFHFPHYRLASGRMSVLDKPGMQAADLWQRMAAGGWHHSKWDHRKIVHASADKVHVDTKFTRYRADGSIIGSYESLYILTFEDGRWGVKMRSSFAQ